jgi:hypothetical protein
MLTLGSILLSRHVNQLARAAHERELRLEEIRPTFRDLTGHSLPKTADNLSAIYAGGGDPGIFLRFETDANGIAYVLDTFSGKTTTITSLNANDLRAISRSGEQIFQRPSYWQETLGVSIFDQESIGSARLMESGPFFGVCYKILIDDWRNTVYMHASSLPKDLL